MAGTNAAGGLKWVKGEIFVNLRRVRDSLEKLTVSGPESAQTNLSGAINALADIRGVLSSLQLVAPTRLTDELQRLCERLDAGQVSDTQEASEALMLALIQLPDYLDKLVAGQSVAPLALLPSINDLRVSGGEIPLSEAELLVPTSVLDEAEMTSADVQGSARQIAAELRPQFHGFLLQWFRGESRQNGLANLAGLFRRFQECFREGFFFHFFLVAEELVEALLEGRIPEDSKSKAAIAHIDGIIKPLATDPQAWPEEQARALFFELLSLVARCQPCSYPVEELLESYGLGEEARQSTGSASPPTSDSDPEAFEALTAEDKIEQSPIEEADALVTDTLNKIRDEIAKAERTIEGLADRPSDHGSLMGLPDLLREAAGALRVLSEDDAAEVLDLVVGQIEERFLQPAREPLDRELDLLAQAISGVNLYLAGKRDGAPYQADFLAEAHCAIEMLRVESSPTSTVILEDPPPEVTELDVEDIELGEPTTPIPTTPSSSSGEIPDELFASDEALETETAASTETQVTLTASEPEQAFVAPAMEPASVEQETADNDSDEIRAAEEVIPAPETAEELTGGQASPPLEEVLSDAENIDQDAPATVAVGHVPLPQDPELIGSFLVGTRGIVDRLGDSLRDLRLAPTESGPLEEMQRSLHTLKGSARVAGLTPIGDLSHALKSLLVAIAHGEVRVSDDTLDLARRALDTLSDQIGAIEQGSDLRSADDLVQTLTLSLEQGFADPHVAALRADAMTPGSESGGSEEGLPPAISSSPKSATFASGAFEADTPRIGVRADLIDHLLSNAGEIGIYCSRLAQQSRATTSCLGELDQTVERLGGQLRRLEKETEAQILHCLERDTQSLSPELADLSSLERDRFSTLQQLYRSLNETVDDLVGLRTLLSDAQSESGSLLQRQARVAVDLRAGLLRTRMVPFAQVVPRLQRLVSQTAQQLSKEVRLEVSGPEVELDRDIQERILAPLEHLLRNAIVHGIEIPEQRERSGKPRSGVISLSLAQDENGVSIKVEDDGAGLNLEAIRKRALDQGLLAEGAQAADEALTELILQSGFSTAEEASQVAGRGIGLDVVSTGVKRLSGSFDLETDPGQGASFAIRVPHSLAIIEALLIQLGDQIFAIPNAEIEDTSHISRADLEACYRGEARGFPHGGQDFHVLYLGSMLQPQGMPDLGDRPWLPVLLARSGEQRIAFHVDDLVGSQRILVKMLDPRHSDLRWLSGESFLPDGSLVLVLDLLDLMRSKNMRDYCPPLQPATEERERQPCVMVVDDSLTVRRSTSRLLQRQNMDVITARDGIEASRLLEERVPDVIVLDMEMPRMDGYELARQIRRSERLQHIPLIMISSRTGEKHRRHALDLGIDRYLGKPFQEMDLLDEISSALVEVPL